MTQDDYNHVIEFMYNLSRRLRTLGLVDKDPKFIQHCTMTFLSIPQHRGPNLMINLVADAWLGEVVHPRSACIVLSAMISCQGHGTYRPSLLTIPHGSRQVVKLYGIQRHSVNFVRTQLARWVD